MRLKREAWEAVKGWALAVLVLLSLGLSARVWLGAGGGYPLVPEREYYRAASPGSWRQELTKLLAPSRLVVHLGEGRHTAFRPGQDGYQRFWAGLFPLLSQGQYPAQGWVPQDPEAVQRLRDGPGLEAVFPVSLPIEVWAEAWGGQASGQAGSQGPVLVDAVFVGLGDPPQLLIHRAYTQVYLAPAAPGGAVLEVAGLRQLLSGLQGSRAAPYVELVSPHPGVPVRRGIYVPEQPPRLAPVAMGEEAGAGSDPVAEFFPDPSVVREMVERDGATIYTDGRRSLRVYPDGELEYQAPVGPEEGESLPPLEVLRRAVEFVALHRGFPEDACLSQVDFPPFTPLSRGAVPYRLTYMARHLGLPVVNEEGMLEVSMTGDVVSSYRRHVRIPAGPLGEPRPVISARQVLDLLNRRPELLGGEGGPARMVTDVYLAYICVGGADRAVPTWAVELEGGRLLFFDAFSGEGWSWTGGKLEPF
ncbi:MAG: hypothetical protein K6T75_07210 [Acetobacteraceae bacterium]|nr:hypothetical protein [Acetobacteraceae bacterium]